MCIHESTRSSYPPAMTSRRSEGTFALFRVIEKASMARTTFFFGSKRFKESNVGRELVQNSSYKLSVLAPLL